MRTCGLLLASLLVVVSGGSVAAPRASADEPQTLQIWLPNSVPVVEGETKLVFIGRPTTDTGIVCPLGVSQSAIVLDPGGGAPAQIVAAVLMHDHVMRPATRYTVTQREGVFCIGAMELYTATLD